ncbi:MAG: hypothetical protein A2Y07_08495 [Planctomycetes bacterium GWF2_50_10]|nr:MAG: hypothetical protein A2Y07_08495 [Planctomycetes bacterium GWF2_50_10]
MNSGPINNLDEDILQAKADLLKSKNIVPPFGKPPMKQPDPQPAAPDPVDSQLIEPATPILHPAQAIDPHFAPQPDIAELDEEQPADFETDPEIEARILANLESCPQPMPPQEDQPEPEDEQPKSWIEMIKAQAASSTSASADIPKYNLAEQIMAQQRKLASDRRKAPGRAPIPITTVPQPAIAPQSPSEDGTIFEQKYQPFVRLHSFTPPADIIIAKIVARDIARDIARYVKVS